MLYLNWKYKVDTEPYHSIEPIQNVVFKSFKPIGSIYFFRIEPIQNVVFKLYYFGLCNNSTPLNLYRMLYLNDIEILIDAE